MAVIPPSIGLEGLDVVGLWVNRGNKRGNLEGEQDRMEEGEKMPIEGCDDSRDYTVCPRTHTTHQSRKEEVWLRRKDVTRRQFYSSVFNDKDG